MAKASEVRKLCDSVVKKRFGRLNSVYNDKNVRGRRIKYVGILPTVRQCNSMQKILNASSTEHEFVVLPANEKTGIYSDWSKGLRIYIFDK